MVIKFQYPHTYSSSQEKNKTGSLTVQQELLISIPANLIVNYDEVASEKVTIK